MDLHWFYADRENFVAFSRMTTGMPNSFYSSELVEFILHQNWDETRSYIIKWFLSPYLLYMVCSIIYMKQALCADSGEDEDSQASSIWLKSLCLVTLALWLYQAYFELR